MAKGNVEEPQLENGVTGWSMRVAGVERGPSCSVPMFGSEAVFQGRMGMGQAVGRTNGSISSSREPGLSHR